MDPADLPYREIRQVIDRTGVDKMLDDLNSSSNSGLVSRVKTESYELLHDRSICEVLGINYANPSINNGYLRADYAALLIVKKESEKRVSEVSSSFQ